MVTVNNALVVRGLRKSYGDVLAVHGLDLEVRAGECFGLLGPNGAGKTATILGWLVISFATALKLFRWR